VILSVILCFCLFLSFFVFLWAVSPEINDLIQATAISVFA